MKNKTNRGPGRPMAAIKLPNRKFTFADLCEANEHVTPLTLRKFLKRDAARLGKSQVVLVKNETRDPDSKKGLGRKTFVYISRARKATLKNMAKSRVSVSLNNTSESYEKTKEALAQPSTPIVNTQTSSTVSAPVDPAPTHTETAADVTPVNTELTAPETPAPAEQVPVAA